MQHVFKNINVLDMEEHHAELQSEQIKQATICEMLSKDLQFEVPTATNDWVWCYLTIEKK